MPLKSDRTRSSGVGPIAWTINVDPDGHISTSEAEDTLEVADTTSSSAVVAPTSQVLDPGQIESEDNPGLKQKEAEVVSTGVPDETTMG
jgi:hypothetical protein